MPIQLACKAANPSAPEATPTAMASQNALWLTEPSARELTQRRDPTIVW